MRIVKALQLILFLSLSVFTFRVYATIFQMEELYNFDTGQTLIFASDVHTIHPLADTKQCNAFVSAMLSLGNVHLISEQHEEVPPVAFAFDKDNRWVLSHPKQYLLYMLYEECKLHNIAVHAIDFRENKAMLAAIFDLCEKSYVSYDALFCVVQQPHVTQLISTLLKSSLSESETILKLHIQPCLRALQVKKDLSKKDNCYLVVMKSLLADYTKIDERIKQCMATVCDADFMDYFFHDMYQKSDNGDALQRQGSLYSLMQEAANKLLDLAIVQKLHELHHERVIIVHSGAAHLQRISHHMTSLGFVLQHKIAEPVESFGVDIQAFMQQRTCIALNKT